MSAQTVIQNLLVSYANCRKVLPKQYKKHFDRPRTHLSVKALDYGVYYRLFNIPKKYRWLAFYHFHTPFNPNGWFTERALVIRRNKFIDWIYFSGEYVKALRTKDFSVIEDELKRITIPSNILPVLEDKP